MVVRPEYHILYDQACRRGLWSRLRFLVWFWRQLQVDKPEVERLVRNLNRPKPRPSTKRARAARPRPRPRLADAPYLIRMAPRSQQLGWLRHQPGYVRGKGRWPWT